MPGDDLTIATDQHWIDEAEPDAAVGDLSHLRKGMGAGIPRIGCQSLNRYPAQFGMAHGIGRGNAIRDGACESRRFLFFS